MFQSTPPRRRRHWGQNEIVGFTEFQSTPPRRRRPSNGLSWTQLPAFQSTPPRRRRRVTTFGKTAQAVFQSTPPRRRRLPCRIRQGLPLCVSIHASAQEATNSFRNRLTSSAVSIHASAQEATMCVSFSHSKRKCFNPRLRAGGDLDFTIFVIRIAHVSIHASAQEATSAVSRLTIPSEFQSTPPRRRRPSWQKPLLSTCGFQSTPPRRRRPQDFGLPLFYALISCLQSKKCAVLSSLYALL